MWSKILTLVEQCVYICPTLGTVLYWYFSTIRENVSKSSQYTFAVAVVLFVFFLVYRKVFHRKIDELRQATVQTETDLKNTPVSETDKRALLAENARKMRGKLDTFDRFCVLTGILIFTLALYILEQAMVSIVFLCLIALASIAVGSGIHIGVLAVKKKEQLKRR